MMTGGAAMIVRHIVFSAYVNVLSMVPFMWNVPVEKCASVKSGIIWTVSVLTKCLVCNLPSFVITGIVLLSINNSNTIK